MWTLHQKILILGAPDPLNTSLARSAGVCEVTLQLGIVSCQDESETEVTSVD